MYYHENVEIQISKFGGKGLFTTKQFKAYQTILAVPKKYFIDYDKLVQKYSYIYEQNKNKRVQFAFYLSLEMRNKESAYQQYLDMIPQEYSNPIIQQESSYQQLQTKTLIQKLKRKKHNIVSQIKDLMKKVVDSPSLNQILRCYCIVESRTLFYKTELDPKSQVGVLVPLYDMANHSEEVNQENIYNLFYYDAQTECYLLKAYKNLEKGQQIFISYGSYDNQHFIEYYGFIPENNPNNLKLEIKLRDLIHNKKQLELKLNLIKMKFPQEIQQSKTKQLKQFSSIYINSQGDIQESELIKLLCLKPIAEKTKSLKELNAIVSRLGNEFYEIEQYSQILNKLKLEILSRFPTTLEFDQHALLTAKDQFTHLCIYYRIVLKSQISRISVFHQ